jgi:hypothetical protein
MQCKDIPDERVVQLAQAWRDHRGPGVVEALMDEFGIPYKLAYVKVESLCSRKNGKPALLEYGVSPNYAWPA